MTKTFGFLATTLAALTLTACGGGGGSGDSLVNQKVTVDDLATGSYIVAVGDQANPTVGKYYAAADGSRLLVLADSTDHATQLYRKTTTAAWVAVPAASGDVNVALLRNTALTTSTLTTAALAGSYVAQVATGVNASFTVDANGNIAAGASTCKLSGTLAAGVLPGTLKLSLTTSACGTLPASSTGVVTVDADYAPAAFRMVADNGTQLLDLWAYKE